MADIMTHDDIPFVENLKRLKDVLDCEYHALLSGDAKTVAALAAEKEHIADDLKQTQSTLGQTEKISDDISRLARSVDELAKLSRHVGAFHASGQSEPNVWKERHCDH
jgi:flagellar biosynthesis/type III secretory pathway chaperone